MAAIPVQVSEPKGMVHFVGHREFGILLVFHKEERLNVSHISTAAIQELADIRKSTFDVVFAELAGHLRNFTTVEASQTPLELESDPVKAKIVAEGETVRKLILGGKIVSDAAFCFVTQLNFLSLSDARWRVGLLGTTKGALWDLFSKVTVLTEAADTHAELKE